MSASQPHPAREELFAYRDGELKHDRRVVIEAHVLGCHICRELIDDVSRMEADLSVGAPVPKDAYFERLSDQVMVKVAKADTTPSVERRWPEAEAEWEEKRTVKPKLPLFAFVTTASAAAAVIIVGVLLVREGAVWRRSPSVAVLERSAPDAARSRARADSASRVPSGSRSEGKERADQLASPPASAPSEEQKIALGKVQSKTDAAKDEAEKQKPIDVGSGTAAGKATTQEDLRSNENKKLASEGDLDKEIAMRQKDSSTRAAAPQPSAAFAPDANAPEPVGGTLKSLLDRYGLPPVWGPAVSDDQVLRAEPSLRNLYRVGGAAGAADSARVRLYLAEAARVRAGAAPDSAAVDEIVHHYRRAIRLAGNDAELRNTAAERLQDFLNELGDEPALHPPQG